MKNIELYKKKSTAILQYSENKPLLQVELKFHDVVKKGNGQVKYLINNDFDLLVTFVNKAINEVVFVTSADFTNEEIKYLITAIINECLNYSIDEIIFVLRSGVRGRYGKIFGKPTIATILQWFEAHREEKREYFRR